MAVEALRAEEAARARRDSEIVGSRTPNGGTAGSEEDEDHVCSRHYYWDVVLGESDACRKFAGPSVIDVVSRDG